MSAELSMSASADAVEFPYRALSKAAIASILFFVLALPGLMPTFAVLLVLALVGAIAGLVGIRATRKFPDEFSGHALAVSGFVINAALFVFGVAGHTYVYLTEVPEGYQRVQFYDLQQDPKLPDSPTQQALTIDGEQVFLKGYIHPSSGSGVLRQFILVPDLGTCCFGGQPRSTDMIEVTLQGGQSVRAGFTKRKLAGKFVVNQLPQKVTDFDNVIFYRMRVDQIR